MRTSFIFAIAGVLLGTDACYVRCSDGSTVSVGSGDTVCPGHQTYINAAPGYADVVHFDGGRAPSCVDSQGFSLKNVPQNVIGCDNGVKGACCGRSRC